MRETTAAMTATRSNSLLVTEVRERRPKVRVRNPAYVAEMCKSRFGCRLRQRETNVRGEISPRTRQENGSGGG